VCLTGFESNWVASSKLEYRLAEYYETKFAPSATPVTDTETIVSSLTLACPMRWSNSGTTLNFISKFYLQMTSYAPVDGAFALAAATMTSASVISFII